MRKGELAHLAVPGGEIAVRVTPKASRNAISEQADGLKVTVTTVPEGGKATQAVRKLLARALGIAPSQLELIRGETSRDKVFRVGG
ncbi:MAG: DUF167 domain-containing protein [Tropicimonas sp.]|uniref:DUF167 domain-containing protein n=1 Tax=Tropicimonas sp. TaxID=2067044 RepID=UPI003A85BB91